MINTRVSDDGVGTPSHSSADSEAVPGQKWAYRLEGEVEKRILAALLGGYGAVLEGEPGAGRSRIAESILDGLAGSAHVVQISSLTVVSPIHDAGPAGTGQGNRDFVHALWERLIGDAGGLPVVINVPGSHVLTRDVASNLGLLVLMGGVSLLVVTPIGPQANDVELGRTVYLDRVRIPPLNLAQAAQMLREGLNGDVSHGAILQLWAGSAHQRRLMEDLCLDWVEAGYLRRSHGLWIASGNRGPVGDRTLDSWKWMLGRLDRDQARALEIVALARRLPLEILLKMSPAAAVDEIHRLGFIESVHARVPVVQLKGTAGAEAIVAQVPPGRASSLLMLFQEVAGDQEEPISSFDRMAWETACGISVGEPILSLAASEALERGDLDRALELGLGVSKSPGNLGRLALELQILTRGGHLQRARQLIEMEPVAQWVLGNSARDEAELFLEESEGLGGQLRFALASLEYFVRSGDLAPEKVPESLAAIRAEVSRQLSISHPVDNSLSIALAECDSMLLSLAGQLGWPQWGRDLPYTNLHLGAKQLWQWQVDQNIAAVWRGDVLLGIQRARELRQLSHQDPAARALSQSPRTQLLGLLLSAGEWVDAGELLDDYWTDTHEANDIEAGTQLFAGMVKVLQGRYSEALELLVPEGIQLREHDPHDLLPIALAGSALAYASLGDHGRARQQLFSLEVTPRRSAGARHKVARFLEIQAMHRLGSRVEAESMLSDDAANDLLRGNISWVLIGLSALICFGRDDAVSQMREVARLASGRFAEACRQFAEAYQGDDFERVILAADSLEQLGHSRFSQCVREKAHALAPTGLALDQPSEVDGYHFADSGRLFEPGTKGSVSGVHGDVTLKAQAGALADLTGLTARQTDIVVLAIDGRSNREIAQELSISVRTVESHLYQIFNKLGIQKRSELNLVWESAL